MTLSWQAEVEGVYGGITAEGIAKLLGAPDVDKIEVLVRETVQNSWDAATDPDRGVTYTIAGRTLDCDQVSALESEIFNESIVAARNGEVSRAAVPVVGLFETPDLQALYIEDTGTRGLGGPLHAGSPALQGEFTDFRDFVFKVGTPPDHDFGGGSYGFGKAIGYLASAPRTIIVFTRTSGDSPEMESRLIACALGPEFAMNGLNHTGRHWWGRRAGDHVGPLTGVEAENLARKLGIPLASQQQTGTCLMVLAPDLDGRSLPDALEVAAWSLLRNFWPKMIPETESAAPPIRFQVSFDGTPIPVPDPDETAPMHLYSAALRAVRRAASTKHDDFVLVTNPKTEQPIPVHIRAVRAKNPKKHLGMLGIAIGGAESPEHRHDQHAVGPLAEPSHAAALVRAPELVVRYSDGPEHFAEGTEWAGLFKVDRDLDRVFQDAEPPTHDDWAANHLQGVDRTYVNVALRRIPSLVQELFDSEAPKDNSNPAWQIATELGDLLPSETIGTRPKRRPKGGAGGGGSRVKIDLSSIGPQEWQGRPAARFEFSVDAVGQSSAVRVNASVAAHEDGRPDPSLPVRILGVGRDGTIDAPPQSNDPSSVVLTVDHGEKWTVVADQPAGYATSVAVRAVKDSSDHG